MSAPLQPSKPIDFLLVAHVDELRFIPDRPEGIRFRFVESTGGEVLISLCPPDTESVGFDGLECKARMSKVASSADWRFISSIIERRFEAYEGMPISLPYTSGGRVEIDEKGNIRDGFGVPFEFFPESVRNFCDSAEKELGSATKRFLKLLRWQQNLDGPHSLFEFGPTLYWKIVGKTYRYVQSNPKEANYEALLALSGRRLRRLNFSHCGKKRTLTSRSHTSYCAKPKRSSLHHRGVPSWLLRLRLKLA